MKDKWLHTFELEKIQKVKETSTDTGSSGEEIQITKEVEKKVPHKFYILNPTRKIQDEAAIFYSIKVSEGIKLGLITKAFLLKKFQKEGILASDAEKTEHASNYSRAVFIEVELEKIKQNADLSDSEKALKSANLTEEYKNLRSKIYDYEFVQNSLFDNTAEKRSSDLLSLWYVLNLLYSGQDGSDGCLFGDGSFDQKLDRLHQIDDSGDEFLTKVTEKGAFLIGQLNSGVLKEDLVP